MKFKYVHPISLALFFALCLPLLGGESFRILFLTDTHITPGNPQSKAMEKVVEEVRKEKDSYDIAVINGDITNMGSDAELNLAKSLFDRMELKYLIIPGNHESTWSESAVQTFNKLWGNDRFEYRHGDFYLIAFSTGPYMKMGDGHVKAEDLHWLDNKLKENTTDPNTKVIVFAHYPLNTGLGNWPEVISILDKYNVVAAFCGHGHQLVKYNYGKIPGFMGRPLIMKYDQPPGYNVIEVKDDVLTMTPREVGIPVGEPFASFRLGDPSALEGLKVDPAPESAGGELPDSVRLTLVRADEASIFGGPALLGNRLVYGNSIGMIKACEIAGSRTRPEIQDRWTIALDHAASVYSTPLIAEDRLIVGSANGELLGLNLKDGSRAWSIPATVPISNDGTLAGGSLYMGLGTDEFCKIDPRTGRKIWSYKGVDGRFQGAPTVAYGTVVFGAWNQCLYALDEQTGRELWVWKGGREGNLYSPGNVIPVVSESQVVIVAPDRFMTAIDRKTGKQIWRDNSFAVRESTGSSPGGDIIYAKTMKGEVIAVSAKSDHFNLLWKCETGVTYDHVPCPLYLHGKTLYYGSPTGVVAAIDASSGQKLWSYKTGNSSVNRFNADEQGRVWFTLIEGKIYCIAPGSAVP